MSEPVVESVPEPEAQPKAKRTYNKKKKVPPAPTPAPAAEVLTTVIAQAAPRPKNPSILWSHGTNKDLSNKLMIVGDCAVCPRCGARYPLIEASFVEDDPDNRFTLRYFMHDKTAYYVRILGRDEEAGCTPCYDKGEIADVEEPYWDRAAVYAHHMRRNLRAVDTGWFFRTWPWPVEVQRVMLTMHVRPYGGDVPFIPMAELMTRVFPDAEYAGKYKSYDVYFYHVYSKPVRLWVREDVEATESPTDAYV